MTAEQPATPTALPASVGSEEFKAVFRRHPAGVAVITCATPDGPAGFTATSVISVAANPAMLAFSVAAGSTSRRILDSAPSVVVNFLSEDQQDLAHRFAARGADRFAGIEHCSLPTGEPVLPGTTAWIRGVVEQRVPVGDSLLITLRAVLAHHEDDTRPLVYLDRAFPRLEG
ncbi:flavin reductase family protein [Georgenia satyanarayanai]|uniref:flavin reductase family protein n=1 Tax=Georgenia satyanarayanai TaxID=860221 RepID=UPI002041A4AB|nr:flavin reductase family protein [Georgenia satyanarayanai]MCM3659648.1 flavin reductase family protein [Georgenia satyanarayanai]